MNGIRFNRVGGIKYCWLLWFLALGVPVTRGSERENISLAGNWRFEADAQDIGLNSGWWGKTLPGKMELPGVIGREKGSNKIYAGAAWYQREIDIPKGWNHKRILLFLERPQLQTGLWLDGTAISTNVSLSTPHTYELGTDIKPGKHTLMVRVDNRSDHHHDYSEPCNGVVGRIELQATDPVFIEDAQVYPNSERKSVLVKIKIGNRTGHPGKGMLSLGTSMVPVDWKADGGGIEQEIALGKKAKAWDEFEPALQHLKIDLKGSEINDQVSLAYGLRNITTEVDQFILNGRPIFLRGTIEFPTFPGSGFPPMEERAWKDLMKTCQAYGLNHVRFANWCPPEAAFAAADDLGLYLSIEVPNPSSGPSGSKDKPDSEESEKILRQYGNHPSFILLAAGGSESSTNNSESLAKWLSDSRTHDGRHLYTGVPGGATLSTSQYNVIRPAEYGETFRGRNFYFEISGTSSNPNGWLISRTPKIIHELGGWCGYAHSDSPGVGRPLAESLKQHGLASQWKEFAHSSSLDQALAYKEQIEAALRTREVAGFQMLDLRDFLQEEVVPVGLLNTAGEPKGDLSPEKFRRFCNSTVLLATMPKRIWLKDETFSADIEVAHFGSVPLKQAEAVCVLFNKAGELVARGQLPPKDLASGQANKLGKVVIPLKGVVAPGAYRFVAAIKDTPYQNEWNVWVYPSEKPREPVNVLATSHLDSQVFTLLKLGRRVLWQAESLPERHPQTDYRPIRWNGPQHSFSGESAGLLCKVEHPALAGFPTDFHTDAQWEDVLRQGRAVIMSELPRRLQPVVQVIDDWHKNRKLGLIFECRVGKGRLLVCGADLEKDLENRPAARQLRASLIDYMASINFNPAIEVSRNELLSLLRPEDH